MSSMKVANIGNMHNFFAEYMKHDGDWAVPQLAEMQRLFRGSSNAASMRSVNQALDRANKIMHGHGVEEITGRPNGEMSTVALYVNMGDTYSSTIIYDVLEDKFFVGTWGDWYEWREENKDYGLKEIN